MRFELNFVEFCLKVVITSKNMQLMQDVVYVMLYIYADDRVKRVREVRDYNKFPGVEPVCTGL